MNLKSSFTSAALIGLCGLAAPASAQLLITELQPDVIGNDVGEWIEIQNLGTSSVSLGGYTLSDASSGREVPNFYAFPATASVAPGQVLVIARQVARFNDIFPGVQVDYELADTLDDMGVPNLTRTGTGGIFQLGNTGDAVFLRNAQRVLVSGVEYGNTDSMQIPGAPFPTVQTPTMNNNVSLTRIMNTGTSLVDFTDRLVASPGSGFMSLAGPVITNARARPRHIVFGQRYTVTASVASREPLQGVNLYFATATSSLGAAIANYAELEPVETSSGSYSYAASIESFGSGQGFGAPATFHERYVRWFFRAADQLGAVVVEPSGAVEGEANTRYLPMYLQNVLPAQPTPIVDARLEGPAPGPRWAGHSVRVRGTAIVGPGVIQPGRVQFALVDGTAGIAVFDNTPGSSPPMFEAGDVLEVTGTLNVFRGLTQIGQNVRIDITGEQAPVPTTTVTVGQLLAAGNDLESRLVTITDVDFVMPRATWPDDATQGGTWNVRVTDGTGELTLRVTPGAVGVFGAAAPQFGFHVTGVVGEFDGTWQIFPRSAADIVAKPMPPPPPDAGVDADASTMPGADAAVRADAGTTPRLDSGTTSPAPQPTESEGCSCGVTSQGPSAELMLGLALLAGLVLVRRRR
jgi:MYXO-CTERM domain-containing protein